MRIVELDLLAFGPFSGVRLDLGRTPALHLVFGPNEAGKSTALRAIGGLLFGIPATSPDAHRHRMSDLRIRAVLALDDGSLLEIVRRKGNKDTLLDAHGRPIPEAVLVRALGGTSEALFRTMYGLDDVRLREGAEALLRGGGDVGESLFDAAVGGRSIRDVLEGLRREADELYRPRGQNQKLNAALRAFKDAEGKSRREGVASEAWRKQKAAIEDARKERAALDEEGNELLVEQSRLRRLIAFAEVLVEREQRRAARAALGDVVVLAERATEQRRLAEKDVEHAGQQRAKLHAEVGKLEQDRAVLLREFADAGQTPVTQRPGSASSAAIERAIRERSTERSGLDEAIGAIEKRIDEKNARRRELEVERASRSRVPDPRQVDRLDAAIARARKHGDLDERTDGLRVTIESSAIQVKRELERLGLGGVSPAQAQTIAVPSLEENERFADAAAELDREAAALEQQAQALETDRIAITHGIDALEQQGDVPSAHELERLRAERDRVWSRARLALEQAEPLDRSAGERLAVALEAAVRSADQMADRLRWEADRVSRRARLVADQEALERQWSLLDRKRKATAERRARFAEEWCSAWRSAGVEPRAPVAMRPWLSALAKVRSISAQIDSAHADLETLERTATRHIAELDAALAALGELPHVAGGSFAELVDRAERVARRHADIAREAAATDSELSDLGRELRDLGETRSARGEDLARWNTTWNEHLRALGLDAGTRPNDALALLDMLARWKSLAGELETKQRSLAEVNQREADAQGRLAELVRTAGVASAAELEAAEHRSREALKLDQEIAGFERQLARVAEGTPVAPLIAETLGLNVDRTQARLAAIADRLEEVHDELQRASEKLGSAEKGLTVLQERTGAADAAAEAQEHLAAIRTHARHYARARIATLILEREVERYRERHQGPVLTRAGELFPRLTLGAYTGLRAGFDDDAAVLRCVRADGSEVGVDGLSDGTRDQLFLALRLASLEHHATLGAPVPLVLDDVLIHFDDQRARAALEILDELTSTTQVLLFTHHARVVELAREAIPAARRVEHRLAPDERPCAA